jgi:GT2 family glycosyltransferase
VSGAADLTVVVVTYESSHRLRDCLSSLERAAFEPGLEVVVVDNGSSDGSAELVRRDYPWVDLLVNETNLGLARAANRGARRAAGRYLMLLNPDVVVGPGSLAVLHRYLEENPAVALAAPRLLNPDGSLQHSCRRHYTLATYLLRRAPLRYLFPRHPVVRRHLMLDWDHAGVREVDWVLGAAMMLRREAVGEPVLDQRYFLYFEDVDLCLRLQRQGWKVVYHPGAEMLHHHERGSGRDFLNRRKYHHFKSWLKFECKHALARPGRSPR